MHQISAKKRQEKNLDTLAYRKISVYFYCCCCSSRKISFNRCIRPFIYPFHCQSSRLRPKGCPRRSSSPLPSFQEFVLTTVYASIGRNLPACLKAPVLNRSQSLFTYFASHLERQECKRCCTERLLCKRSTYVEFFLL